jgi:hypothetical protein
MNTARERPRVRNAHMFNGNAPIYLENVLELIKNVREALDARLIRKVDGLEPRHWEDWLIGRAGNEPFLRILYIVYRAIVKHDLTLMECLCEDPALIIQSMENGDVAAYYQRYPQTP